MTSIGGDPHRVLGVRRDASEAEIKGAYRALAKRHHPDGGHGSVARFLEIQAAYETLAGDDRSSAAASPGATSGTAARPGTEWGRRPRPAASRRRDPGPTPGGSANAGPGPAADPPRGRPAAGRRRATLESTSYDEAEEVFEPGWGGASWYGPSSGTYWTLNPREYADPRKHGPEYQARARRRAAGGGPPPADVAAAPRPPGAEPVGEPAATPATPAGPGVISRILEAVRRGRIHA